MNFNNYPGGKNGSGVYQKIISMMPPHSVYIEGFLGSGAILRNKRPAKFNFGIEIDEIVFNEFWKDFDGKDHWHDYNGEFISQIRNENFFDFVNYFESKFYKKSNLRPEEVLIYCDVPYLGETRRSQQPIYRYEMLSEAEHKRFLRVVKSLPYLIMISGYKSNLYRQQLKGWRTESFHTTNRAGHRVLETVWMNFEKPFELHDYRFLGESHRQRDNLKRQRQRWLARLKSMPPQKRFALMSAIEELKRHEATA